jgi:hypothetical protein
MSLAPIAWQTDHNATHVTHIANLLRKLIQREGGRTLLRSALNYGVEQRVPL